MPTARRIATPRKSPRTAQSRPAPISPVSKAGITTWSVDQPSTQASATVSTANSTLPEGREREDPGLTPDRATPALRTLHEWSSPAALPDRHSPVVAPLLVAHRRAQHLDVAGYSLATDTVPIARAASRRPMTSLARRERHALCDLALELGPDAPTLCGDWTTRDLLAHLLVREGSPMGSPGMQDLAALGPHRSRDGPRQRLGLRRPGRPRAPTAVVEPVGAGAPGLARQPPGDVRPPRGHPSRRSRLDPPGPLEEGPGPVVAAVEGAGRPDGPQGRGAGHAAAHGHRRRGRALPGARASRSRDCPPSSCCTSTAAPRPTST